MITFLRRRDYKLVKELGHGGCGKTVLLYDDQIDEHFVCKKYSPQSEAHRQELFAAFVLEIKLLHKIHHANIVRVFNYYLYPAQQTGYILMEFIDGLTIDEYLLKSPEQTNEVFMKTINGFGYLESSGILHRDIRPGNVMIGANANVKIIDFGFGKEIRSSGDFDKSISLNWWCQTPAEFDEQRYDFRTEVYFVGKLFEKIIQENSIAHFRYMDTLRKMCCRDVERRTQSFAEVTNEINQNPFFEIEFSEEEKTVYRRFAEAIAGQIIKIERGSDKYVDDMDKIRVQLDKLYRGFMLEEVVPDCSEILSCFVTGSYHYRRAGLSVQTVRDFLRMIKSCTDVKNRIVLANLHQRLDVVRRYEENEIDDIPF